MFEFIETLVFISFVGFLYLLIPLVYTILVFISDNNHVPFIAQHLITGCLVYFIYFSKIGSYDFIILTTMGRIVMCFPILLLLFVWYVKIKHGYVFSS